MSGGEGPPADVQMKLEQNAILLGFESFNKDEKGFDEWEREFLRHCMKTQDKHPVLDRDYFEAMGFRGPTIDALVAEMAPPGTEQTTVVTVIPEVMSPPA